VNLQTLKTHRKLIVFGAAVFSAACVLYHTFAPKGVIFSPSPLPPNGSWAFVPLDNRPPCRDFTVELAALGGIFMETPEPAIMDWYENPANTTAVRSWLTTHMENKEGALLSTDLLIFGGLLHSRQVAMTQELSDSFFNYMIQLREENPDKQFYLFTVIPRLLINDQIIPDRWYQWHLMTWVINMDKKIRGLPYDEELYESVKAEIPMELKWKYLMLYRSNDLFNEELVQFVSEEGMNDLVIGQDDAHPYGLPNYNRTNIPHYVAQHETHPPIYTSQGADELGTLAAARIYTRKKAWQPRIKVMYGTPAMKDYTLPFVPLTLEQIALEKIHLANGVTTENTEDADFILYLYCGDKDTDNASAAADEVKTLVQQKPVALVDMSKHFAAGECLLPHLVANGTPLGRLIAYAGWNTASNSVGTAVAQATIVTGQALFLPKEALPDLYARNVTFNMARFLDDWAYQKMIRPHLSSLASINGADPPVSEYSLPQATAYTARQLAVYKTLLTLAMRRHPYYEQDGIAYYVNDIDFTVAFPWERAFEIDLKLYPHFAKSDVRNS
jgi:hypothetical protein